MLRRDELYAPHPRGLDEVEAASLPGHAVDPAHPGASKEPYNDVGRCRHCRFLPVDSPTAPAFLRHQQDRVLGGDLSRHIALPQISPKSLA